MPLYEYECPRCGRREEMLQAHGEIINPRCPHCHKAMRKLLSAPAIQFKGSGWYVTDCARRGSAAKASDKGEGEKPSEKKEEKPKPEKKTGD